VARIGESLGDSAFVLATVGGHVAKGDSLETAIMKAPHLTGSTKWIEDTGNKIGDETYRFVNRDLPEAMEFAKKDIAKLSDTVTSKVEGAKQAVEDAVTAARERGAEIKDEVVRGAVEHLDRAKAAARSYLPSWLR
jgi:hypothetical protein